MYDIFFVALHFLFLYHRNLVLSTLNITLYLYVYVFTILSLCFSLHIFCRSMGHHGLKIIEHYTTYKNTNTNIVFSLSYFQFVHLNN